MHRLDPHLICRKTRIRSNNLMSKILASLFLKTFLSSCGINDEPHSLRETAQCQDSEARSINKSVSRPDLVRKIDNSSLLGSLKDGGYVIYFRHATTEKDYADQADPLMSLDNCNSQRKLSLQGQRESYDIGMAFASNAIPVGHIIVSEYCRSWKTANLAFGEWTQKDSRLNFLPYDDYTNDHIALMKKNVMPLLTRPPLPGTNTIIIGHDDIFESATGIYPEPQGVAYVLMPDGKRGFNIIANVLPSEWSAL